MTVPIPDLVAEFSRQNWDLTEWTDSVFSTLCENDKFSWRFLNTLSYMEHIGSYKIMATQRANVIDYSTLKHLNEETGHAVLFKRQAERISGESLDYSAAALMAPASARAYFSRLEIAMIRLFGSRANYRTIYLYMSMIVEFRAVWAYEILQRCLDRHQLQISLNKLLAEEQGHLYSMVRRLQADQNFSMEYVNELWQKERNLYTRLLRKIEALVDEVRTKAA